MRRRLNSCKQVVQVVSVDRSRLFADPVQPLAGDASPPRALAQAYLSDTAIQLLQQLGSGCFCRFDMLAVPFIRVHQAILA